ncbi:hypothetical protein TNCV_2387001 [Trichonephila clavipes]|nr:hypothetical protein TNCV_2387001 [Trichonephila clavipes]
MVLKATANDRRHLALCHQKFRGHRSGFCRSGGIGNNNNSRAKATHSFLHHEISGTIRPPDLKFVTLLRRLGIPRCDWASVEDLGSVCIEHIILSCLAESSCP